MLRKFTLFIFTVLSSGVIFAQSAGTLQGIVKDPTTGETIPFANVSVEKGGSTFTGGMTDFDGKYVIKPIPAGKYVVKVSFVGYNSQQVNDVVINGGKITFLDFKMTSSVQQLNEVVVTAYKTPLISKDQTQSGGTVSSEAIAKMPGRDAASVATTVGGVYSENGGVGSIRGARDEGNVTYIDGIKVRGSSAIPKSAVEEVSVITGGMPAEYGDATGGVISIVTKGPSETMFGGIEAQTSHFLDPYNNNLVALNISGPLYSVRDKNDSTKSKTVLGFLLASEFSYIKDDYPSAIGFWQANDDVMDYITTNPVTQSPNGEGTISSTEMLTKDAFQNIKAANNAGVNRLNMSGKIEYQPNLNFNFTVGGSIDYENRHSFVLSNSLFNSENNPQTISSDWRVYGRMTQKFIPLSPDDEQAKASIFKNAFYSIQIDYSRSSSITQDDTHKDNLFNYGYVGKFEIDRVSSYSFGRDSLTGLDAYLLDGSRDTIVRFTPSDINKEASAYNEAYFNMYDYKNYYENLIQIGSFGGLLNGEAPGEVNNNRVYGLWSMPGVQYNNYSKYQGNQYRMTAKGSADVKNHEISVGFEFEQRQDRYYDIAPKSLWTIARGLMNDHISELDKSKPILTVDQNGVFMDTIKYDYIYNGANQYEFDINFRNHLGLDLKGTNYVDIDSYDPSELSIDYFSPDELLSNSSSYLTYYGYDARGNKLSGNPSLKDFFTATYSDELGNERYKREIPSFMPVYMAGYIQDKFAFKDLILRIGLRVDRYDANQKVLKDPFSLSAIKTVAECSDLIANLPENIGDDYFVYIDDINVAKPEIRGYRTGSTWYTSEGVQIDDPTIIKGASGVTPYLYDEPRINEKGYDSDKTFEDYKPQINISPRVGFSFPISDVALFTAHYDVLSKRPSYGSRLNPIEYYYIFSSNSDVLNNPNAKSEKTIDYELGFQQKLSNSSALKLSAFYREMRDMQQVVNMYGAYPVNYMTYGNVDFGTVKGFTVSYDLRKTGNVTLTANYTLQFANGTGSDAATGLAFAKANQPNLRATLPFDYDQRHAIVLNMDYRFGEGSNYNGPKWFGTNIFQNTGANFVLNVGSGSPFSRQQNITETQSGGYLGSTAGGSGTKYLEGTINGSRKPWRTTLNLRLDKDIVILTGSEENQKEMYLNIYLDVSNVLNKKNILRVYRATGNADDDGYLSASEFQNTINETTNPEAYRNYYSMAVNSPYNYSLPRTIVLGASLSF